MKLKQFSESTLAFFQATGVIAYIMLGTMILYGLQGVIRPQTMGPVWGVMVMLTLFVTSAFITGSMVLSYPVILFLEGKKRAAVHILLWSGAWFIVYSIIFLGVIIIFA